MTNHKLRKRGARILEEAAQVGSAPAERALRQAKYDLPRALVMLKTGASPREAKRLLNEARANVRAALETPRKYAPSKGRK